MSENAKALLLVGKLKALQTAAWLERLKAFLKARLLLARR